MSGISALATRGEYRIYAADNDTSDDYALSDDTLQLTATTAALRTIPMTGYRGLSELIFTGTDGENEAYSVRLYLIDRFAKQEPRGLNVDPGFQDIMRLYCTYTVTLGTKTGVENGIINDNQLIGDTITATLSDFGTQLNTVYGITHQVYSPGSDSIAFVSIMDLFDRFAWTLDFNMDTAASGNAIYRLST
jgi:hypothetical protein